MRVLGRGVPVRASGYRPPVSAAQIAWAKVGGASVTIVSFLICGANTRAEMMARSANAFMAVTFRAWTNSTLRTVARYLPPVNVRHLPKKKNPRWLLPTRGA